MAFLEISALKQEIFCKWGHQTYRKTWDYCRCVHYKHSKMRDSGRWVHQKHCKTWSASRSAHWKKPGKRGTFVDACAESTLNCRVLANPGPRSANKKPNLSSLKPYCLITDQEWCKDIRLQQKFLRNSPPITDTEFRFFRINAITETEFRNFRIIFVTISVPKVFHEPSKGVLAKGTSADFSVTPKNTKIIKDSGRSSACDT